MRHRLAFALVMPTIAAGALLAGATPASAVTATVNNNFVRTCTWSCSAFVQVNGPYNPAVRSTCITKNWWGGISSQYTKWGRC